MGSTIGLSGQNELCVLDDKSKYSLADITPDIALDSTTFNRKVSFSAGNQTLADYIATHLNYPEIAREICIEGTVVVRFTVSLDGKIMDPIIIQSVHDIVDAEIIDFINNMPDWTPSASKGQIIETTVELPFVFRLR